MPEFIGRENLESIATKYAPSIAMGAVMFRPAVFDHMKIKVISGIQFREIKTIVNRKGHTSRRKVVGDTLQNRGGYLEERVMELSLAWNRFKSNKDAFMEDAVVNYDNDSAVATYPLSEIAFQTAVADYGEDLYDNLWHGDTTIDRKDPELGWLGLFDGFYTYLLKDKTSGRISAANGNLAALTGTFEYPVSDSDLGAWTAFLEFYGKWNSKLKNANEVLVYCTGATGAAIAAAYENSHGHHAMVRYQENRNFSVAEYGNITFCPDDSLGVGDLLIATLPFNFEYGVNNLGSDTRVDVQIGSDDDSCDIFFQVQSAQGTRVFNVNPSAFCMTDGLLTPSGISGDYTKDLFIAAVNDSDFGSVTVNGATIDAAGKEYPVGTTLALVAAAESGYHFVKWSDGNTSASRSIVTKNAATSIVAIFAADMSVKEATKTIAAGGNYSVEILDAVGAVTAAVTGDAASDVTATVAADGKSVKIAVAAGATSAQTATVTLTDGLSKTATITVTVG